MTTPPPKLFVISAAEAGDPLDCVAAAIPLLAPRYEAVHRVGAAQSMSVRSMRRLYAPGLDRLLYDFTAHGDHGWAMEAFATAPGAALLCGRVPVAATGALADMRSAQRYAEQSYRPPPLAAIAALEAMGDLPADRVIRRPAADIAAGSPSHDLALSVAPGSVETAYRALLGLASSASSVTVLAAARRDANDMTGIIDALQMRRISVRYIRSRSDAAAAASDAPALIDVVGANQGPSDAAFAAQCLGASVLPLTAPDRAEEKAAAFAASKPQRDPDRAKAFAAERPIDAFAKDIQALIQAGWRLSQREATAA